jgi:oxygen-independent coproporphyrinogen-3 oxidase
LEKWAALVERGERVTEDRVALTPALLAEDALIFGLRMNAGVDVALWRARCPDAPWAAVEAVLDQLVENGLAVRNDVRVQLTDRGRLLADSVGTELMTAFSTETIPV